MNNVPNPFQRRGDLPPGGPDGGGGQVLLDVGAGAAGDGVLVGGVARLAQRLRVLHEARGRQHQRRTLSQLVR